ncbi:hypothetical protein [Streptomyces sp. PanSC9]|uniref:hypothetical protein n=1 Tax=Streptomyces sp. PanSC9 TaxID=1520461 RepID=UPI000F4A7E64|nr:hypothetical protein [Streptomyces sp. PanSC9]ROP53297.1 hypothetical protein EDD94_2800 [Streptomyces sp. PanSC9]
MSGLTALADALSEHPEEPMALGVLLGLLHRVAPEPAACRQLLSESPAIPVGATRGEYALLLRLTVLEVHP